MGTTSGPIPTLIPNPTPFPSPTCESIPQVDSSTSAPSLHPSTPADPPSQTDLIPSSPTTSPSLASSPTPPVADQPATLPEPPPPPVADQPAPLIDPPPVADQPIPFSEPHRCSSWTTAPPVKFRDYIISQVTLPCSDQSSSLFPGPTHSTRYPLCNHVSYHRCTPVHRSFLAQINQATEPRSYSEVAAHPAWQEAM
ncbi:proline-rich receptor-like protein kinase PERK14 [Rosa chinensis]|uniref:proline-rich receptor-like protein kinase PERK14 n=1 Tax=Rosa chinensis TaxID=74649 RepID=UPI000D087E5A|nr:proline-rich receptor-like protein kinase PERK14 [Rosa chinensis]